MAELGEGLSGYLDVQDATLRAPRLEAVSNIGIANTAPQHAFSVGSNLYVDTESSNVLTVDGNVVCEGVKVGLIEIIPSYDLAAVSNVGNVTQSTIQFSNATTGFVTTANIEVGTANLFVDTVSGRVGIGKTDPGATLDVAGDVEISSNLAVSGSKFTYDNTKTTVFTGTAQAEANEIGYLDMSTSTPSNNIHVKVYIKFGQGGSLGDAEYSFYIRPNSANFSLIYDYKNQLGPITPVVYRTNANDLWSGGTPGVVRFGYSIASAHNVIWRVEVQQRSGSATFYPTNTGSAMVTTDLVQVTPAPYTRIDSNVNVGDGDLFVDTVNSRVGIGTTTPVGQLEVHGEGQATTTSFNQSGNLGGILTVKSSNGAAGDGGGIMFGANQGYFAAIKGTLSDGNDNTSGELTFCTRNPPSSSTMQVNMVIDRAGNVGIGTTIPRDLTHIRSDAGNAAAGLLIEQNNTGIGSAALRFGVAGTNENTAGLSKAGIFFKRSATNGRGHLYFCIDNVDNTSSTDTSDAALTITAEGYVQPGQINTRAGSLKGNYFFQGIYDVWRSGGTSASTTKTTVYERWLQVVRMGSLLTIFGGIPVPLTSTVMDVQFTWAELGLDEPKSITTLINQSTSSYGTWGNAISGATYLTLPSTGHAGNGTVDYNTIKYVIDLSYIYQY